MPIQILSQVLNVPLTEAGRFYTFLCKILQPVYVVELAKRYPLLMELSYGQFLELDGKVTSIEDFVANTTFAVVASKSFRGKNSVLVSSGETVTKYDFNTSSSKDTTMSEVATAASNVVLLADFRGGDKHE
jgi:hypothetical protein